MHQIIVSLIHENKFDNNFKKKIFTNNKDKTKTMGVTSSRGIQYSVYNNVDAPSNDIGRAPAGSTINTMADICDTTPGCIGFNSNGWLKSTTPGMMPYSPGTNVYKKSAPTPGTVTTQTNVTTQNPVDCVQSEWSKCSRECGGGIQTRTIVKPAANSGKPCGPEWQECNKQECAQQLCKPIATCDGSVETNNPIGQVVCSIGDKLAICGQTQQWTIQGPNSCQCPKTSVTPGATPAIPATPATQTTPATPATPATPPPQARGFWARIFGWFGKKETFSGNEKDTTFLIYFLLFLLIVFYFRKNIANMLKR